MNVRFMAITIALHSFCLMHAYAPKNSNPLKKITKADARTIGLKIWQNECAGKIEGLLSWNNGEGFPSLGIPHAIWHTKGSSEIFKETFPTLLAYFKEHGIKLPPWLDKKPWPVCPWNTQEEFENARSTPKMQELAALLQNTIWLQTMFMIDRLRYQFPNVIKKLSLARQKKIKQQFDRMLKTAQGIYVLVDYVNFKGEGIQAQEHYNDTGWGLIQVLEKMKGIESKTALQEFAAAACAVLEERVRNAPPERNEARWLPGWYKRIATYTL